MGLYGTPEHLDFIKHNRPKVIVHCKKCGAVVDRKFCPECGAPIEKSHKKSNANCYLRCFVIFAFIGILMEVPITSSNVNRFFAFFSGAFCAATASVVVCLIAWIVALAGKNKKKWIQPTVVSSFVSMAVCFVGAFAASVR